MDFKQLVGNEYLYYGTSSDGTFKLEYNVWRPIIRASSLNTMLEEVILAASSRRFCTPFVQAPLAIVKVVKDFDEADGRDGYALEDSEYVHIWLRFGTRTQKKNRRQYYFESFGNRPNILRKSLEEMTYDKSNFYDLFFDERQH